MDEEDDEDDEIEDEEPHFITMNTPLNPNYDPNDPLSNKYIPYEIRPKLPYVGMKGVDVYVNVPTEIKEVPQETKVVLKEDGVQVDISIQDPANPSHTIDEVIDITGTVNKNVIAVGRQGEQLVSLVTNLNNSLNQLNRDLNNSIEDLNAEFNKVGEVSTKMYDDVKATSEAVETIVENQQQIQNKITTFEPGIVTRLGNIDERIARNTLGLRNLSLQMAGEFYDQYVDDSTNKRKKNYQPQIHNVPTADNFVFQMPEDLKQKQKDEEEEQNGNNDNNNNDNNNNNNDNNGTNLNQNRGMIVKRFKGSRGEDVTRPLRGVYYDVQEIGIDDVNIKYNEKNYGMFDVQNVNEIRLLDIVTLNITENDNDFEWDIDNNYINTPNNTDEEYPNGFNPLGVKRFKLNIDVQTNRLKDMNEWEQLSTYAFNTNNTALIKYNGNNLIEPQEITNRDLVLDEYQGDGKTIYDPNEKIFINNHKYTFSEENEEYDENIEGFKSVMQTTIVPIMDRIVIPKITSNKTFRYSIQDFNNIYSLTPGSENTYRNDFIGFNSIDIPVDINTKTVPLLATQDGIYRPSDIDPTAIGFSSVQVSTTSRSSGGGSSGDVVSVKNLENYVFRENNIIPYTIADYNAQFNTNFTGFDSINVNVNDNLEKLNVDIKKIGNYKLSFGEGENILTGLTSNNNDICELTGSPQSDNNGYFALYKAFDGIINEWNGFCSSSSNNNTDYHNYVLIHFKNGGRKFEYFNIYRTIRQPLECATGVIISGSNNNVDYIELYNGNINPYDGNVSKFNQLNDKVDEYEYYNIQFTNQNNTWLNVVEMELMKTVGNYSIVDVNVNTGNLLMDYNKTIDSIENNVKYIDYPFTVLTSEIPYMNNDNSVGASINIIDGGWRYTWRMFKSNLHGEWADMNADTGSFILTLDNEIDVRSIFISIYTSSNETFKEIKVYGSNDNLNFELMYENLDMYNDSVLWYSEEKYIYDNIKYIGSFRYFKFEFRRNGKGRSYIRNLRLFSENKYIGFENVTIINNTYSKTANPVCTSYSTANGTVNVQTSDTTAYPYVRRGNMSVPLEDKVIKYNGKYIPGKIDVGSGFYGIRSVVFEDEGNEIYSCTQLFENNAVSGDMVDNWYINGDYRMQLRNQYNSVINVTPNTYRYFDGSTVDINECGKCRMVISNVYPFIMNGFAFWMNTKYNKYDTINIYVSNDDHNYEKIYSEYYYLMGKNWNEFKFYANDLMYKYYAIEFTFGWLTEMKLLYCTSGDIINKIDNIYYNYKIDIDQPGTYYYDKPVGYSGINNIIVNYSTGEPVSISQTIIEDGQYTIVPPEGKRVINEVKLNVQCVRNEDVNVYNTITESGFYEIPQGFTGFNSFYVDFDDAKRSSGIIISKFYNVNQNIYCNINQLAIMENNNRNGNPIWRINADSGNSVCVVSFFLFDKKIKLLCIEINNQSSYTLNEQWYVNFLATTVQGCRSYYYYTFPQYLDSNFESHIQVLKSNNEVISDMVLNDLVVNNSNYNSYRGLNPTHIIETDENDQVKETKFKFMEYAREDIEIPYLNIKYFCGFGYTKYIYDRLPEGPYTFGSGADEGWADRTNYWCYKVDLEEKVIYWKQIFHNVYNYGYRWTVPSGWKYSKSRNDNPGFWSTAGVFDNLNNTINYNNVVNLPTGEYFEEKSGEIDIAGKYIYRIVNGVADWVYIEPRISE